ncbi:unnamed protein product [Closterium sp. NIES-64]|nr:unnamed protein product [Closterium sp. NIES-64]
MGDPSRPITDQPEGTFVWAKVRFGILPPCSTPVSLTFPLLSPCFSSRFLFSTSPLLSLPPPLSFFFQKRAQWHAGIIASPLNCSTPAPDAPNTPSHALTTTTRARSSHVCVFLPRDATFVWCSPDSVLHVWIKPDPLGPYARPVLRKLVSMCEGSGGEEREAVGSGGGSAFVGGGGGGGAAAAAARFGGAVGLKNAGVSAGDAATSAGRGREANPLPAWAKPAEQATEGRGSGGGEGSGQRGDDCENAGGDGEDDGGSEGGRGRSDGVRKGKENREVGGNQRRSRGGGGSESGKEWILRRMRRVGVLTVATEILDLSDQVPLER